MCLTLIESKEILKAEEDIICYKHFIKKGNDLYSSYRGAYWPNEGMEASLQFRELKIGPEIVETVVTEGLHAFEQKIDCELDTLDLIREEKEETLTERVVMKMIIPKGAMYYKGVFGGATCFASNKMIFAT